MARRQTRELRRPEASGATNPSRSSIAPPTEDESIARIAAWLSRHAEVALGDVELSLPQYRVLNLLAEGKALPSSLADRLNVRRPSITVVVDGLVARGLVARSQDRDDRRRVTHSITDQGKGLLEKADASVDGRLRSIAARLGEEDAEEAIRGLSRWGPAIREWRRQRTSGAGR